MSLVLLTHLIESKVPYIKLASLKELVRYKERYLPS